MVKDKIIQRYAEGADSGGWDAVQRELIMIKVIKHSLHNNSLAYSFYSIYMTRYEVILRCANKSKAQPLVGCGLSFSHTWNIFMRIIFFKHPF